MTKKYPKLKRLLKAEFEQRTRNTDFFIENGFSHDWPIEKQNKSDYGIKLYSTDTRLNQYTNGLISREKAVEYAKKRAKKELEKSLNEDLVLLENIANAPTFNRIDVVVEWKLNRTWGNNPHATVNVHAANITETYTGKASGCGYDKRSTAVSNALNQSFSVLQALCDKKEKILESMEKLENLMTFDEFFESVNSKIRNTLGAGVSYYNVIPKLEYGVGIKSTLEVFEKLSFETISNELAWKSDYYTIYKK